MSFDLPGYGSFKTTLVVGAARSGIAAAALVASKGGEVLVADSRAASDLPESKKKLEAMSRVQTHFGGHPPELADRADLVVVSPGVPLSHPLFARARERSVPVIAEVELAGKFLEARTVGITGSNGKSTTTALIAEIARAAGLRSEPAGNFGRPLSELVGTGVEFAAIELSSFQLEGVRDFRTDAAALLNVTPDHMDRYASFDQYAAAKARIFGAQHPGDAAVLNADDPRCSSVKTNGRRYEFSRTREVSSGAFVRNGVLIWRDGRSGGDEVVASVGHVRISGPHNLENALAAVALARSLGLPAAAVTEAIENFPGLPHRSEPVGEIRGMIFVNDSKGTNVDATLKSLESFLDRKVWLILGGRDKGGDFKPIGERLASSSSSGNSHAVLTVGEAAKRVRNDVQSSVVVIDCGTIEKAVDTALEGGKSGDAVLLSPACASFDQFRNFEHRGDEFRRIVRERMNTLTDRGED